MRRSENERPSAEIRADAAATLDAVLHWELTPDRWDLLAETIDAAAAAEAAGDLDALQQATLQLKLAGPVRHTRIGSAPTVPPPPVVHERVTRLIHTLLPVRDTGAGGGSR
jgi:hypothetical protein